MLHKLKQQYGTLPQGLKATLWYTFCNLMQKGINVLVVPIYTRLLSAEQYGIYGVFISWVEIFEILATFRMFFGAYVVGLVKFSEDRDCYTSSLEKLSLLITTAVLSLYLLLQSPINRLTGMTTDMTLMMFAMLYAIPVAGFWKAMQRVDNSYRNMVLVTLALALGTPIWGILGTCLVSSSAVSVIMARVGIEVLVALVIFIVWRKCFTQKTDRAYWKYALSLNVPLIPFYLSTVVLNHSDRIVIQRLVGNTEAAIYSVAYSAAMIMSLFNTAFDGSLQPWLFKKLKAKVYDAIPPLTSVSVLIVAMLNLLLIAVAPEAIRVLAPPEYGEAVWIIPPLAASVFVMFFYQRFINVEFYFGESKATAAASIGAAVLNLALNFMLIPVFGYLAAGYTTLFSYVVFWIVHYCYFQKVCRKNGCPLTIYNVKQLMQITLFFAVATCVLSFGYIYAVIRYAFMGIVLAAFLLKRKALVEIAKRILSERK